MNMHCILHTNIQIYLKPLFAKLYRDGFKRSYNYYTEHYPSILGTETLLFYWFSIGLLAFTVPSTVLSGKIIKVGEIKQRVEEGHRVLVRGVTVLHLLTI